MEQAPGQLFILNFKLKCFVLRKASGEVTMTWATTSWTVAISQTL